MKILMADDDLEDRNLFRIAFRKAFPELNGHTPALEFVKNGEELMNYLTERKTDNGILPDLIFLDLNMPRKNGREALREIKSDERLKVVHIIIFSTSSAETDKAFCRQNGANDYIEKPFEFSEWVEMIKRVCEKFG